MARDGGGVYTKPAGSTAATGTTVLASEHNTPVDDFVTDANLKRPIVAGGTNATNIAGARDNFDIDAKVLGKSADYTAVLGDRSKLIRFTAAKTLSLTAAATLGDGWFIDVEAKTGTTTIDPDGTENIDGSSTSLSLTVGRTVRVRCDGSAFFTQFLSLVIGTDVQAWDAQLDTIAAGSAANATAVTNLTGTNSGDESTATASAEGISELATLAEGTTGTDTARITSVDVADAMIVERIGTMAGNQSGSAPVFAARAWVRFDGTGTPAIDANGNVSSITDNGTGDYTINFTTAMAEE